jgi:hypothetical protein
MASTGNGPWQQHFFFAFKILKFYSFEHASRIREQKTAAQGQVNMVKS